MGTKNTHKKGFTIVELLVVIVIIGILAAIVTIAYNGIQRKATDSVMQSTLKSAGTKMKTTASDTDTFGTLLPGDLRAPAGIGLALATVTSPSEFCINVTSQKYADLSWHIDQALSIKSGLCTGAVIPASIIGDYANSSATTVTSAITVQGDGGGLVVKTDEPWNKVEISWAGVSGVSRYEVQLRTSPTGTWQLRRITATASNPNGSVSSYQNDTAFSARIPSSTNSITWEGQYAVPQVVGATHEYRVRSYDAQGVAGSWSTASLAVPTASSLVSMNNLSVTPSTDWTNINVTWSAIPNDMPNPIYEIQLRENTSTSWSIRRILDTSSTPNAAFNSSYATDSAFSTLIPYATNSINWKGQNAIPYVTGTTFEYRIRLKSATITGLSSDWFTTSLTPPLGSNQGTIPSFTATPSSDWSNINLNWSAPNGTIVPSPVYEVQLRNISSSTWSIRRVLDSAGNPNTDFNSSYSTDPAFSALIPYTTNTINWKGQYAVPLAGQTFEYRIRQKSNIVSGLYSDWVTRQVTH